MNGARGHRVASIATLCVTLVAPAVAQNDDRLVLRRGEISPSGGVVSIDQQGVGVQRPGGEPRLVPWSRVLRVESPAFAAEVQAHAEIADLAWRASLRLERGDAVTAEPMFERLVELVGDGTGPTTRQAWEGLWRCRQARGALGLAVEAWARGVDAAEPWTLEPTLAPIWPMGAEPPVLASRPPAKFESLGDELLAWFRSSARIASGLTAELPEPTHVDDRVALVADVVRAQSRDRAIAAEARQRLLDRLDLPSQRGDWTAGWIHAAVGRSLLNEESAADRELGVVHLLHVPAQWSSVMPGLAETALTDAAAALDRLGDERARDAVLGQLRLRRVSEDPSQEMPR